MLTSVLDDRSSQVIRVLIADDHQAVRAGLVALLRQEPGFAPVATAADAEEAAARAAEQPVDVALVDYHLPDASGIEVCRRLGHTARTVLYTAVPLERILVPALVAGVGGAVSKSAPTEELFDAIRAVAKGDPAHPQVSRWSMAAAAARLSEEDLPIIGMAIDHTSVDDMAAALRIDPKELDYRIGRIVDALAPFARSG